MNERIVDGTHVLSQHSGARKADDSGPCMSCGSHLAENWSTSDGVAVLCRECATLHGLGCP